MKHNSLARQLTAQFFRGNLPMFALAVFAALTGGTLNLIVTWLMQQLIDAACRVRCRWGSWHGSQAGLSCCAPR